LFGDEILSNLRKLVAVFKQAVTAQVRMLMAVYDVVNALLQVA